MEVLTRQFNRAYGAEVKLSRSFFNPQVQEKERLWIME